MAVELLNGNTLSIMHWLLTVKLFLHAALSMISVLEHALSPNSTDISRSATMSLLLACTGLVIKRLRKLVGGKELLL